MDSDTRMRTGSLAPPLPSVRSNRFDSVSSRTPSTDLQEALYQVDRTYLLRQADCGWQITTLDDASGSIQDSHRNGPVAVLPATRPEDLGDPGFRQAHGLKLGYVAGAMANGIASVELVEAMGRAGMLGFFGAAGLAPERVAAALERLQGSLRNTPFGVNLIHSPNEPRLEAEIVDLFLKRNLRLVEASAYLDLTLPLVRYRTHGVYRDGTGRVVAPNRVVAKVSRVEVASKFFAPPPVTMLRELVQRGDLTSQQAEWASRIPVAEDLTAEADSAGHTDNRPALTLLPTMLALRDRLQREYDYASPLRVGAAGGIATPAAAAAAFAMGAAYLVTGSVNQACVESGSSDLVREMLAQAEQADTIMAPAADMFEMGVKVQVLKRGTLFAMRAARLYEIYRTRESLDDIPASERSTLEKTIFRLPLETVWQQTEDFFKVRDPGQLERARQDARHKMALVFRWYLGQSSRWANAGDEGRKIDFQVWCGPAMGAFNEWTRGSFLAEARNRRVVIVALNLLYGAAVTLRAALLRSQGLVLPAGMPHLPPLELAELRQRWPQELNQGSADARPST